MATSGRVHHVISYVSASYRTSRGCFRTFQSSYHILITIHFASLQNELSTYSRTNTQFVLSTFSPSPCVEDRQYDTFFCRHAAPALCRRPARSFFPPVVLCEPPSHLPPTSLPHTILEHGRQFTDLAPARGLRAPTTNGLNID